MSIIRPVDGMPIAEEHFEALQAVVHASDKKNVPATMTINQEFDLFIEYSAWKRCIKAV